MANRTRPPLRSAFAVVASLFLCSPAAAQSKKDADDLFEQGVRGMEAGDFASGCPALKQSFKIDPLPGTLFTLAECERLSGKTASALHHYEQFLDGVSSLSPVERKKHREREGVAQKQRDVLAGRVPKLTLSLAAPPPPNSRLTLDGDAIDLKALGTAMAVDPGDHALVLVASDGVKRRMVTLVDRDQKAVELSLPIASAPQDTKAPDMTARASTGMPAAVYVTGTASAVGIVVGAAFGFAALGKKSAVSSGCDAEKVCTPDGKAATDSVKTLGMASNIGFAVGALALRATIVLILTRDPSASKTLQSKLTPLVAVGPRDAWLGIGRSF